MAAARPAAAMARPSAAKGLHGRRTGGDGGGEARGAGFGGGEARGDGGGEARGGDARGVVGGV